MKHIFAIIYFFCLIAQFVLCLLVPLKTGGLVTLAAYTIHVGVLSSGLLLIFLLFRQIGIYFMVLVTFCLLNWLLATELDYMVLVKTLCFLEMLLAPLLAYYVGKWSVSYRVQVFMAACVFATAIGFLYQYTLHLDTHYQVYFLGLNKNYSGGLLLLTFSVCMLIGSVNNRYWIKLSAWGLALAIGYLIWMSRCRTAMIILLVECVLIWRVPRWIYAKTVQCAVCVVPVVFMTVLLVFPQLNKLTILSGTSTILDGREILYYEYFHSFSHWFLVGDLGQYAFQNSHNGCLAIFVSIGLVGWLIWYFCQLQLFDLLTSEQGQQQNRKMVLPFLIVLCLYTTASSEAMIFVQGQQVAILLSIPFYYAAYYKNKIQAANALEYRK